ASARAAANEAPGESRGPFVFRRLVRKRRAQMGHITGLKCKECGKTWPKEPTAACAECWGPLEAVYDLDAVRRTFTRDAIAGRARDLWRYAELLPLDGEPTVGRGTGFTPLLAAP